MESAIYHGEVFHNRLLPKRHAFKYKMSMMYVDLDEIDEIFRLSKICGDRWLHLLRYKRTDFHGNPNYTVKEEIYKTLY